MDGTWKAENQEQAEFAKQGFRFFAQPQQTRTHEEEYPKY
jgi:hypothetical protein